MFMTLKNSEGEVYFHIKTHRTSYIRCSSTTEKGEREERREMGRFLYNRKGKRRRKKGNGEEYMVIRNVPRTTLKRGLFLAGKVNWKLNNDIKHWKFRRNQWPSAIYPSSSPTFVHWLPLSKCRIYLPWNFQEHKHCSISFLNGRNMSH